MKGMGKFQMEPLMHRDARIFLPFNQRADGSNPSGLTNLIFYPFVFNGLASG
jgi:hypothetical protein